jgi:hypothetical protein
VTKGCSWVPPFALREYVAEGPRKEKEKRMNTLYSVRGAGVTILASTTPPTATQAAAVQRISALVNLLDADTGASITHNWGLDASAPSYYQPTIKWYVLMQGSIGGSFIPMITFDVTNTNVVKVYKAGTVGSGCSIIVTIRRGDSPWG